MPNFLSPDNLIPEAQKSIYAQDYSPKTKIEGVEFVPVRNHPGDEGDFSEVLRLNDDGFLEAKPDFKLAQINRTKLFPHSIKAWHVHFRQDEMWYVSPWDHLFVGLWDLRQDSPTANQKMRIVLGCGQSQILFIPKGVAHGSANFAEKPLELFYFVNQRFDLSEPDEKRIPWDTIKDFWTPERD
jgi:dTDP-4-dehydrorhamnose 3,5-epimerase